MWIPWAHKGDQQYLEDGRLADVLALIQVLSLDTHAHRSEGGLQEELQGKPRSADSWESLASMHPEFFRVRREGEHRVSLIARHVLPKADQGAAGLPSDFTGQLITSAVDLHDRQLRRSERWTYLIPIWVALIAGVFAVAVALLKIWFPGD